MNRQLFVEISLTKMRNDKFNQVLEGPRPTGWLVALPVAHAAYRSNQSSTGAAPLSLAVGQKGKFIVRLVHSIWRAYNCGNYRPDDGKGCWFRAEGRDKDWR